MDGHCTAQSGWIGVDGHLAHLARASSARRLNVLQSDTSRILHFAWIYYPLFILGILLKHVFVFLFPNRVDLTVIFFS